MNTEPLRTPTDEQVQRIVDRRRICDYFHLGIFAVRRHQMRLLLEEKTTRSEAANKINERIDDLYTCITDSKLGSIQQAPEFVHDDIHNVRKAVIADLLSKDDCQVRIDTLFRKMYYKGLI